MQMFLNGNIPCVYLGQGFIDVFFFLFLDERNNWVRVTNYQSPLSPIQFFDLRRQQQLSDHPSGHRGPNFLFLELVTCTRCDTLQVRTVSNSVCSVPCYLLSMRLLSFSFTTFYCHLGQTFYIPWFTTIFFKDQMSGFGIKIKIKCLKTKI